MRSLRLIAYTFSLACFAVLPTMQHSSAKGPQYPLQEPAPVSFVQDILSSNNANDYCNVSNSFFFLSVKYNIKDLN